MSLVISILMDDSIIIASDRKICIYKGDKLLESYDDIKIEKNDGIILSGTGEHSTLNHFHKYFSDVFKVNKLDLLNDFSKSLTSDVIQQIQQRENIDLSHIVFGFFIDKVPNLIMYHNIGDDDNLIFHKADQECPVVILPPAGTLNIYWPIQNHLAYIISNIIDNKKFSLRQKHDLILNEIQSLFYFYSKFSTSVSSVFDVVYLDALRCEHLVGEQKIDFKQYKPI